MHQLELDAMLTRNGVWILGDSNLPGLAMPVVVSGADEKLGYPGKMNALVQGKRCPTNASHWKPETIVTGGPFTAHTCALALRNEEERDISEELLESELDTWKRLMMACLPMMEFAVRTLHATGDHDAAKVGEEVLQEIADFQKAEKTHQEIVKDARACM